MTISGIAAAVPAPDLPSVDRNILHVQVILDHLGFSPGVLDGRPGRSLEAALRGFQQSRDLPVTGKMDRPTLRALHRYRSWRPTVTLPLSARALAGPYLGRIPEELNDQARLPHLGYRSPLEKLAEMFHTTPQVLVALNGPDARLRPGTRVVVPNAMPRSRDYPDRIEGKWRETLNLLNVDAVQPRAARIVVDKSDGVLRVFDGEERLVAQFGATMGSAQDPLPMGEWRIKGSAYNPPFHYNPALFWDADADDTRAKLPPGPNGPVGVVWIDISKPHYGIHGTPEPQQIGRSESHGCIRLTNWDAARLSLMVKPGIPVRFQL